MKILMIGGTGILSTEVCRLSLEKGYSVTTINRGNRKEHIDPRTNQIVADIRNDSVKKLQELIAGDNYDVVIDFITYNIEQLKKTISVIGDKCHQFIFISSATVYSNQNEGHEYIETDDIHNDRWDYCAKKAECEDFINSNDWNFEYTIIRPYVTYGKTRIPMQVGTLKYYTLLNRINNNKPIVIADKNAVCTLTNVRDFAIGVVGLFLNPKAYGEAFHITSDCRYSWEQVYEIIENSYGNKTEMVEIPMDFLVKIKNPGFELEELFGDKTRNMIFDNTKIKEVVTDFTGDIKFEDGILDSINYFSEKKHQVIDYLWEGRIDRLIKIYSKKKNVNTKSNISQNKENISLKNKIIYLIGRYEILYALAKKLKGEL